MQHGIMQTPVKFRILDSETASLSGGSVTVEVSRGELLKLSKYPALVKELQDAISNGLARRPFEKTNLTFSKRGSTIKLFELKSAPPGSQLRFVLTFHERPHGGTSALTILQIHEEELVALDAFLEWIGESLTCFLESRNSA
jgi:hypothetical protein